MPIGTGGRISSTLRPQWVHSPSATASEAIRRTSAWAASSSGAPRQWKLMIGPLSSIRTRSARSSGVSRSRANPWTSGRNRAKSGITRASLLSGSSSSAPWRPEYSIPPTPTSLRTSDAARPEMQATRA